MDDLQNGKEELGKALSATQSLKNEFKALFPSLPIDWRAQIKEAYPIYRTDKGNTRLDNIRAGYAAPTLDELAFFKKIANVT